MFYSLGRMSEVLENLNRKTDCLSVVDSGLAAAFSPAPAERNAKHTSLYRSGQSSGICHFTIQ